MTNSEHPSADPGLPHLHIHNGCATLTLRRPAQHNRLSPQDLLCVQAHLAAVAQDARVQVLVLTGQGSSFCSGFDINAISSDSDAQANTASAGPHLFEQTVDALEAMPQPSICRLNGSVFGGATDLALACDFRIGVDTLTLRMPAVRLGLHYYPSGLQRYVARLGLNVAKRLFLLAPTLAADELLRIGYLDAAVPADQLDTAVQQHVDALCAAAPLALRGMKASLNEIARGEMDLPRMRAREHLCATSADLQEGKAAFAQRRPPRFEGR